MRAAASPWRAALTPAAGRPPPLTRTAPLPLLARFSRFARGRSTRGIYSYPCPVCDAGSNTYGGCGDINRNIMLPAVHFPNNAAYVNAKLYSQDYMLLDYMPLDDCSPAPLTHH